MDPKVTKLMTILTVNNIKDFKSMATYNAVKNLKERYANTTLEDYLWRLLRVLRATPKFSQTMITRYNKLWLSVGGIPK
jgi:hypothetical protein